MIYGRGLLATAFREQQMDTRCWSVFARGVSNSSETDSAAFQRECALLDACLAGTIPVVYFSSCALVNPAVGDTPYLAHKREMEQRVLVAHSDNRVFRLPQVVGRTQNPNTLTNFLRDRIVSGTPFTIWRRAERNLIDVDDVAAIASHLMRFPAAQRVVNVASAQSLPMPEIVAIFERVLDAKGQFTILDKGDSLRVDSSEGLAAASALGIDLGPGSAERILRKHYGN